MIRWDLAAHAVTEVDASPDLVAAALAMPRVVRVDRLVEGKARLITSGTVGTRVEGPLRVVVHPRHLSREVALGLVVGGAELSLTSLPADADEDDELLRIVAIALFGSLQRLLRQGVRREYVTRVARVENIRGEIDLERWHGPNSPDGGLTPWCRFRERTIDLPEHRLLRGALRALARSSALERSLRLRAAAMDERFTGVSTVAPSRPTWSRLRSTGLFRAYADPIALAAIVLEGLVGEGDAPDAGRGFLLDLDRLFERWLARELSLLAPPGWYITAQETVRISDPPITRYLDVGVRDQRGRLRMILDAKNKAFVGRKPPRDDVHQLVTYMSALRCSEGALVGVGSQAQGPASTIYRLDGGVGRLHVVSLPGKSTITELRKGLKTWLGAEAVWRPRVLPRRTPEVA